jgi:hypothetical protein
MIPDSAAFDDNDTDRSAGGNSSSVPTSASEAAVVSGAAGSDAEADARAALVDAFDAAQRHTFLRLLRDAVPRFAATAACREWVEQHPAEASGLVHRDRDRHKHAKHGHHPNALATSVRTLSLRALNGAQAGLGLGSSRRHIATVHPE